MSEFTAAVAGAVVGFMVCAIGVSIHEGWNRRPPVRKLLKRHFRGAADSDIKVHSKVFPYRVSVDVYRAVLQWLETNCTVDSQCGIAVTERFMSSNGIASFLTN